MELLPPLGVLQEMVVQHVRIYGGGIHLSFEHPLDGVLVATCDMETTIAVIQSLDIIYYLVIIHLGNIISVHCIIYIYGVTY